MMLGTSSPEQNRTRLGLLCLLVGILLLLWAWGSWMYRASVPGETASTLRQDADTAAPDPAKAVRIAPVVLWVGLLLVLLFFFGSYVLIRASRRYRASAARQRATPSPSEDVWAMHKLKDRPEDGDDS